MIPKRKKINLLKGQVHFAEVWQKFKTGDRYAFEEIYTEFIDVLFAYGMKISNDRELVKDSVQDLFVDLYRYDINLKKPESLEYYLFKSLKRLIYRNNRKITKTEIIETTEFPEFIIRYNHEDNIIQNETDLLTKEKIQRILKDLKPKNREILFYKFYTHLSYKEIGLLTGLKSESVKKQVHRLIATIRENLKVKLPLN